MRTGTLRYAVYPLTLLLFGAALWAIIASGPPTPPGAAPVPAPALLPVGPHLNPVGTLLLQMLVIVAATRLCAAAARRAGQPGVIGEVIGGILLGPSVLGFFQPEAAAFLFPPESLGAVGLLSQIGLMLFMFVVGMELDTEMLAQRAHAAVLISHASIVVPFLLGALLSLALYPAYAPAGVPFLPFCLFMGVAMSITAFPVLARLLHERGLNRTPLGTVALACAAIDDVTAWCALAVVAAVSRHETLAHGLGSALLCGAHIGLMLLVVRPVLARYLEGEVSGARATAWALFTAVGSALATEAIGVHALFGAFLAGLIIPRRAVLREALAVRLESLGTTLLLPLFFALSGLRTELRLLDSPGAWLLCAAATAIAIVGKFAGSAAAARWSGSSWRESLALGAMMNTRGLVELVVLNVGYDLGIISPEVFTALVIMALVTTLMTGPLLDLLLGGRAAAKRGVSADA